MRDDALLERDRDRLALVRDLRNENRDATGRYLLAGDQPLDLRRHDLGLGALVAAAPELNRGGPGISGGRLSGGRSLDAAEANRPGQAHHSARTPVRIQQANDAGSLGLECTQPSGAGAAKACQGGQRVAGDGQRSPGDLAGKTRGREVELVRVVDQDVLEPRPVGSTLRDHPQRQSDEIALVTRTRVTQDQFMDSIYLGELALGRGVGGPVVRQFGCPPRVLVGAHEFGLEAVDPSDEAAEQRTGVATEVMVLERQLVDPLGQHRQAIAGREHVVERLQAGTGTSHDRGGKLRRGDHDQLAIAVGQPLLQPCPGSIRAPRAGQQQHEPVGHCPALYQILEALQQQPRLAAPRRPLHQQWSTRVGRQGG